MDDDVSHETVASLAILALAGLALALLLMWVTSATAEVCLNKKEARALWPKQHIYWYSKDHCWSNRRGGPPRGIKVDPVKNSHAETLPSAVVKVVKADEFNELDAQADTFAKTDPFPFWWVHRQVDLSKYKTWYERAEGIAWK